MSILPRKIRTRRETSKNGTYPKSLAGRRAVFESLEPRHVLAVMTEVPLVGAVSHDTAKISVRTDTGASVAVVYSADAKLSEPTTTQAQSTTADSDFTTIVTLDSLQPQTKYFYEILVDGVAKQVARLPYFVTFPPTDAAVDFVFAVTADSASIMDHPELGAPAYASIAADAASFLLQIGDFDHRDPRTLEAFRQMHRDQRDPANLAGADFAENVLSRMPVFHVWDDHDYCHNDADKTCPRRDDALRTFKEYYPTPTLANPDNGIWHSFRFGQSEFFMLDTRSQRDPKRDPDDEKKSMLDGDNLVDGQLDWLLNGLLNSTAYWKFIVSSVTFHLGARDGSLDLWRSYATEAAEIARFIGENDIENVIVLSADLHTGGGIDDGANSLISLPEVTVGHTNLFTGNNRKMGTWSEGVSEGREGGGYALITILASGALLIEAKAADGVSRHQMTLPQSIPPILETVMYFSTHGSGAIVNSDGSILDVAGTDIVSLTTNNVGEFIHAIYIDGADIGLNTPGENIDGFDIREDGGILISVARQMRVNEVYASPGVGSALTLSAGPEDIMLFMPNTTGENTTGTWQHFFQGAAHRLEGRDSNIDGLSELSDGRIAISTTGAVNVDGVSAEGSDILLFDPSDESWSLYLDGSDVGLDDGSRTEGIDAISIENASTIHLSTLRRVVVPGVSANGFDVLAFQPTLLGETTLGSFQGELTVNGIVVGIGDLLIDGFDLAPPTARAELPPAAPAALIDDRRIGAHAGVESFSRGWDYWGFSLEEAELLDKSKAQVVRKVARRHAIWTDKAAQQIRRPGDLYDAEESRIEQSVRKLAAQLSREAANESALDTALRAIDLALQNDDVLQDKVALPI